MILTGEATGADLGHERRELARDERANLLDPAVEIDRRDKGLVAVGEQRLFAPAAGLFLAAPEQQVIAEVQPLRLARERRGRHEHGLCFRLLPFVVLGELAKQHVRDDESEHRIAEEFERLVVDDAAAGVFVGA